MDALILLPSFIKFFSEAKNHSTSPGKLAAIFVAFGNIVLLIRIRVILALTDSIIYLLLALD